MLKYAWANEEENFSAIKNEYDAIRCGAGAKDNANR